MSIASIIADQLGNGFFRMTGAKNLASTGDGLSFRLPGTLTLKRGNYMKITLTPDDLYTVEYGRIRKLNYTVLETLTGVFVEDLHPTIRGMTGLETRMPTVIFQR
jgi:hypothetical protein